MAAASMQYEYARQGSEAGVKAISEEALVSLRHFRLVSLIIYSYPRGQTTTM
jgi:hypothetical protein